MICDYCGKNRIDEHGLSQPCMKVVSAGHLKPKNWCGCERGRETLRQKLARWFKGG